jgi:hypothetical protein
VCSEILSLSWDDVVEVDESDEVMSSFDEVLASVEDENVTGEHPLTKSNLRSMPGSGRIHTHTLSLRTLVQQSYHQHVAQQHRRLMDRH